jgi:indole-3-glycerol phosphate synthase/phosphoribosylanthranilate isomerase
VTADEGGPLAGNVRQAGMLPVGVFRDAPPAVVAEAAKLLNLHAVQLHGAEDAEYVRALRRRLPGSCEIWTAHSVERGPWRDRGGDRLLFDNAAGGSGQTFDWSLVKGHPQLGEAIIAGGIGAQNIREAQRLGAYALDVGSSVDERPGVKSAEKIAALFEALRPASRQRVRECA